jgi:hypothetical protein
MNASRLIVLVVALALTILAVAPTSAQPQQPPSAIVIRAEPPGWGWLWGGQADLTAAALEAATIAARAQGLRVLGRTQPQAPAPVLTLAVSAGHARTATFGGFTVHTTEVTVRATLDLPDASVWRGSAVRAATWLTAPVAWGDQTSAQRQAAYAAAAAVTEAALAVLLPPASQPQRTEPPVSTP